MGWYIGINIHGTTDKKLKEKVLSNFSVDVAEKLVSWDLELDEKDPVGWCTIPYLCFFIAEDEYNMMFETPFMLDYLKSYAKKYKISFCLHPLRGTDKTCFFIGYGEHLEYLFHTLDDYWFSAITVKELIPEKGN